VALGNGSERDSYIDRNDGFALGLFYGDGVEIDPIGNHPPL